MSSVITSSKLLLIFSDLNDENLLNLLIKQ